MSRKLTLHVRFTSDEYEQIKRKADYLNIPVSTFIRRIAVQKEIKRYDLYEVRILTREVIKAGHLLAQILNIAKSGKPEEVEIIEGYISTQKKIVRDYNKKMKVLRPNVLQ